MSRHLFQNPAQAGVYYLPTDRQAAAEAAAHATQFKIVRVAIGRSANLEAVLRELGQALNFPDWYGANLDALYDCLTEPDSYPRPGLVLLVSGLDQLQDTDPEGFSALTEVFRAAAQIRREDGSHLWVLLDAPAPGLPSLPGL